MKKIIITISQIFVLFLFSHVYAQKEANVWYFGKNAGVDFSSGKPLALTNGALSTEEGCVTISNNQGKILFYTDGSSVWNADHQLMPGGTGLKGNSSSTQSGVVIPKPKTPGVYYLFTVANTGLPDGLQYSVIDLKLNNGKGAVDTTQKNILLSTPVTEKLTAVKHRNNMDMWVIAHEWKSDAFLVYLVTDKGIQQPPVKSNTGSPHDGEGTLNTQGYMKANPDGTNIALALEQSDKFELFDFDNATGKISNPISIKVPDKSFPYGVEFSSDGSVFYGSAAGTGKIYQYNLQAGSPEVIQQSAIEVGATIGSKWIGALQIAVDGKIYFPIYNTSYLGVINKPGIIGIGCEYQNDAVFLENKIAQLGLPSFAQSFFTQDQTVKNIRYFDEKNVEIGKRLILNNIVFDFAQYTLKSTSYVELEKVVTLLKADPSLQMELTGHTDNIGNKSSNITLSQNRAKAVKEYLVSKGINESRIKYQGYGSGKPIANNDSDAGRAKNRRVEFVLSK